MNKIAILFAILIYGAINYWLFIRSWQALPPSGWIRGILVTGFLILSLSFLAAMILGNRLPLVVVTVLENIGSYWVIGLLYFIAAALMFDLLRLADHLFGIYPAWVRDHYQLAKLLAFTSVVAAFLVVCLVGNHRFRHPSVRELDIEIGNGTGEIRELTVAAVSDVHLGSIIRKPRLAKYVELINRQKPDLVLFAGDLVDHSLRPVEAAAMDEELRNIKAPLGVYGIFGNHEYYGNVSKAESFYKRSGIVLLRDSLVNVGGLFQLAGRDDVSQHRRKPLEKILEPADPGLPVILLDHNPVRVAEAAGQKVNLQLSGHTHDGQIFPLNHLVRKMYPVSYGYRKMEDTHVYVSSGLGLWAAPVRIGTRSEIVKIRLKVRT